MGAYFNARYTCAHPTCKRIARTSPIRKLNWLPEYENNQIVKHVFDHVDCIVAPSIWNENSPLVIQEALQAKVPVITSEKGGMGELIQDGINGWTFKHRSIEDLAEKLQFVLDNPHRAAQVAQRGFLNSEDGAIHSIEDHVQTLIQIFEKTINGT